MKRWILGILAALALGQVAKAQFTTVSATVRDPGGTPYSGCRGNIDFVPSPGATQVPLLSGSTFQTSVPIAACDSFGSFTAILADNNSVSDGHTTPPASMWHFGIVSQDGKTAFGCNITITGATQNVSAALQACAAPLGSVPAAALKPILPGPPIQFVSPHGNDANDGLSWGSSKRTIYAALEALPGGVSSPPTAGKGTVYLMDGGGTCAGFSADGVTNNSVQAGLINPYSTSGTGIWIMGPTDPNFANPPTGWLRNSGPFSIIGVAGICNPSQNRQAMMVDVAAGAVGGFSVSTQPAVWLSGISGAYKFENLAFESAWNGILLSIDSNGVRTTTGAQGVTFKNVAAATSQISASAGPTVDIGRNAFWIWFEGCTFSANQTAGVLTDNRANMVINSQGGVGSFLITINDNVWNGGGGIKYYTAGSIASLMVNNLTIEGTSGHGQPALWLPNAGINGANMNVSVNSTFLADYTDIVPVVQVDGQLSPNQLIVNNSNGSGATVIGPATILGDGGVQNNVLKTKGPAFYNQTGLFSSSSASARVYGQQDTLRRSFSPVLTRFVNIAPQLPSAWTNATGSPAITTGIPAPDGTTNAGRVSAVGTSNINIYSTSRTLTVGDWIIAGVWMRSNTPGGMATNPARINISTMTTALWAGVPITATGINIPSFIQGDGEWGWYFIYFKVTAFSASPGIVSFLGNADSTHTVDFYAPILLHIPAGTISDNEASEIALHLVTYPETAAQGEVSMLRNQYFRIGSTVFSGLGTPTSGVFIYCPDCTVANPCAGGGTGALAKRLNGVWVCN